MKSAIRLLLMSVALVFAFALGRWAHAQVAPTATPTILSGADIGFRVDPTRTELAGKLAGTWVVRVNGQWLVPDTTVLTRRLASR